MDNSIEIRHMKHKLNNNTPEVQASSHAPVKISERLDIP